MRRIALVNQKGGVGKTTTAVNLSAAIARLDRRVLLVDLDPQSNATVSLGIPPDLQKNTTYALLNGSPFEPLKLSDNFHLIPSNIELAGAEMELTSVIGREIVLRDALADIKGYDFVILDCSPSLGLLSVNALTTVKEVMVPLQCEFLALHGISLLIRTVDLVRKRLNPELSITGVIPCMYDARKGLARDVVVEIEKHFGSKVFKSKIRSNVRLAEAPSHGKTIFDYAPDSFGAEDYLALAREIVGIETIQRVTASVAISEPVVETVLPSNLEIPIPVPELVVAGGMAEAAAPAVDAPPEIPAIAPVQEAPAPAAESYSSAPMAEPGAERHVPAPTPEPAATSFPEAPAPLVDSYFYRPAAEAVVAVAPVLEASIPIAESDSPAPVPETVAESSNQADAWAPVTQAPAPPVDSYSSPPVAEAVVAVAPVPEARAPIAECYSPAPLPELIVDSSIQVVPLDPVADAPATLADSPTPAPAAPPIAMVAPVLDVPAPIGESQVPAAEYLAPAPALISAPEPGPVIQVAPPEAPTFDIVSDGVVEFTELIPLEIEELPYIEPERT